MPGLNKVCRKMDIDCASAIIGFDFHGGWSHPMYDGFVVCEEFADAVVAAWESVSLIITLWIPYKVTLFSHQMASNLVLVLNVGNRDFAKKWQLMMV